MSYASTVFDLHGRLALVTGGASGIGAGIAAMLAAAGAHVVIADRDAVAATRPVAALTQQRPSADAVLPIRQRVVRGKRVTLRVDLVSRRVRKNTKTNEVALRPHL